ncbi:hypothetical protein B9Z19DRAFT_1066867 [Tuber borchii]|uniref:Uncharacterized protein n=1 Tax=Tuber borchii TaxID=42251 RepID=A0A2T6ZKW2_TUBBO|nr:hypothetical protein B9Z19DRAFT_1066867 [Tuber borchii]
MTPRHWAAIVTLRYFDIPITFRKIEDITGGSTSSASDIWRPALANARSTRLPAKTIVAVLTALSPPALPASVCAAPSATTLPAIAYPSIMLQGLVLSVLLSSSTTPQTSIPGSTGSLISDKEFRLVELISASVLDSDSRRGRSPALSERAKDKLVKLVKKNFGI